MQNNLNKYTEEIKSKLDKNFFSPLFVRLAGFLYMNEKYEECIAVCKTGIEIYPNYLTAKLILLKAFLKAEYLNEAEILFTEIKSKITNKDLLSKLDQSFKNVKSISKQQKIYYHKSAKNKFDFKSFDKKFNIPGNLFTNFTLNNLFARNTGKEIINKDELQDFIIQFESFHIESILTQESKNLNPPIQKEQLSGAPEDFLNNVKIITETLADIYAEQGNYKEAFDAYNILLRADSKNKKRIEEKIHELERNMMKNDNI